ncbi:MAG: tetratricopeptide repeat protein [bacterium]|jgi:tetratricopeptide (TPR) repeat protein|nr:tetratricopeptide repeat protein [Betaproteobacteria bacterium]
MTFAAEVNILDMARSRQPEADPRLMNRLGEAAAAAEQAGDLPTAAAAYRDMAQAMPRDAALLQRLGVVEYLLGNLDEAIRCLGIAVRLDRRDAGSLVNLGLAQHAAGRPAEAVASLRKATALRPDLAIAHGNLALALSALGDGRGAVESARRAVALGPGDPQSLAILGNAWHAAGDLQAARAAYLEALSIGGPHPEALYNLGNTERALGDDEAAAARYRQALDADPLHLPAWINLGNVRMAVRDYDGAEAALESALRAAEGGVSAPRALLAEARYNLANLQRMTGRHDDAAASYRRVLADDPMHEAAYSNLLLTLNYSAAATREETFAAHVEYGRRFAPSVPSVPSVPGGKAAPRRSGAAQPLAASAAGDQRLRIGFVSPDFRGHAVALFFEPLLDRLPAHGFEVYCYSNVDRPDEVTARLRGKAAGWRDIAAVDDDAAAALVRRDRIDLLVDLSGHTARHRLRLFARRPAPVQLTMIGHVNTTGVEAIDYRITDAVTEPEGAGHDRWYTERLLRLPHTCWCMRAPAGEPAWDRAPGATSFTFASFNNFAKLSGAALDLWAALLRAVPDSRLVIVTVPEGRTQARLRDRFAAAGVDPSRLELHGLLPAAEYRALHRRVHLALDPFPCNGATTTLETLWLGVPVLALAGDSFRSRNGMGILVNAGLDPLVARSPGHYLEIGCRLAADPEELDALRALTGPHLRDTPLMDEARFAADLAGLLHQARFPTSSPR